MLRHIHFVDGIRTRCEALFFCAEERPHSEVVVQAGAAVTADERVRKNRREQTGVPGLYVAGNRSTGVQLAIVAAAEGAKAAYTFNEELNHENLVSFGGG